MGFEFHEEKEQGDFNSGLAIIYRLDSYYKKLADAYLYKDYNAQYRILVILCKELYGVMTEPERKHHLKIWEKVNKNMKILREIKASGKKSVPCGILDCLDYWEINLRDTMQVHGLGMPKKQDPRYALK